MLQDHPFTSHARHLHQKLANFRQQGGWGGGRGGYRGGPREEVRHPRTPPSKGILRQASHHSSDPHYDKGNYWEQPFDPAYEEDQLIYGNENNHPTQDEQGDYPSTVVPSG